jgi:hypothetical protein
MVTESPASTALQACVLLTCSANEVWAVPEAVLATIFHCAELPPRLQWSGQSLPLLDRAEAEPPGFSGPAAGELVAVFHGGPIASLPFWGLRLRRPGAQWVLLSSDELAERADVALPDAITAFEYQGRLCQVPDLVTLGATLADTLQSAP